MLIRKALPAAALAASMLAACSASDRSRSANERIVEADNSGMNIRDREDSTLTPMDQGESESDRILTQTIRQAVVANDALSLNAKNVKIISLNGQVTLRGPVETAQEKKTIADAARAIAGTDRVTDELEVASVVGK